MHEDVMVLSGCGFLRNEIWDAALQNATDLDTTCNLWIGTNGMKLIPSAWAELGETPPGSQHPVSWQWDPLLGPPAPSSCSNHPSALVYAEQLGKQLDEAERLGLVEF